MVLNYPTGNNFLNAQFIDDIPLFSELTKRNFDNIIIILKKIVLPHAQESLLINQLWLGRLKSHLIGLQIRNGNGLTPIGS